MDFILKEARAEARELLRKKEHATPWQPIPVLVGSAGPVILFVWIYACACSRLRYYHSPVALVAGAGPAVLLCAAATAKARRSLREVSPARASVVLAVGLWMALASGAICAELNYRWHLMSYFRFQDAASYANIDPSRDRGQSYMDAGQVYFKEASRVAVDQVSVYRNDGVFCAAPILRGDLENEDGKDLVDQDGPIKMPESGSVDWWAVGMNCCDQETKTFTCGQAGDPRARAGIRLLRDDIRPLYALAVQEWTARLCPVDDNTEEGRAKAAPLLCPMAKHPLFFHWVVDPLLEVDHLYEQTKRTYCMQMFLFFVGIMATVLGLHWGLFHIGLR